MVSPRIIQSIMLFRNPPLCYVLYIIREQSDEDVNRIISVLRSLLTCDLSSLPTPVLFHKFMFTGFSLSSVETYTKCINYQVSEGGRCVARSTYTNVKCVSYNSPATILTGSAETNVQQM